MNSAVGFDWAKRFRLHAAAALIAGVPVCSKKEPDMEEIHAEARPVLVAMLTGWAIGVNYQKGQPVVPDYPVAQTLSVEELGCEKPVALLVRRAELHRWIAAMGLPSVYDFSEPALKADRISVAAELLKPVTGPVEPEARPGTGQRWTPERLAALDDYRAKHTMPETAAKFGISEQRIRQLLPTGKAKPKTSPFPTTTHHIK